MWFIVQPVTDTSDYLEGEGVEREREREKGREREGRRE